MCVCVCRSTFQSKYTNLFNGITKKTKMSKFSFSFFTTSRGKCLFWVGTHRANYPTSFHFQPITTTTTTTQLVFKYFSFLLPVSIEANFLIFYAYYRKKRFLIIIWAIIDIFFNIILLYLFSLFFSSFPEWYSNWDSEGGKGNEK